MGGYIWEQKKTQVKHSGGKAASRERLELLVLKMHELQSGQVLPES